MTTSRSSSLKETRIDRIARYYRAYEPNLGLSEGSGSLLFGAYDLLKSHFSDEGFPDFLLVGTESTCVYLPDENMLVGSSYQLETFSVLFDAMQYGSTSRDVERIVYELAIPVLIRNGRYAVVVDLLRPVMSLDEFSWNDQHPGKPFHASDSTAAIFALSHEIGHWMCSGAKARGSFPRTLEGKRSFVGGIVDIAPKARNHKAMSSVVAESDSLIEECICDSAALDMLFQMRKGRMSLMFLFDVAFVFMAHLRLIGAIEAVCGAGGGMGLGSVVAEHAVRFMHFRCYMLEYASECGSPETRAQVADWTHELFGRHQERFFSYVERPLRLVASSVSGAGSGVPKAEACELAAAVLSKYGRMNRQNWKRPASESKA